MFIYKISFFLLAVAHALILNKDTGYFFTAYELVFTSVLFAGILFSLIYKYRAVFVSLICFLILPNILINPVSFGLQPILNKEVRLFVSKLSREDPRSKWAVFGRLFLADFIQAYGADVFNRTRSIPDFDSLQVLDPDSNNRDVYNRFSYVRLVSNMNREEIKFSLLDVNSYYISIHPGNNGFNKIGVRYFVFSYKPSKNEIEDLVCMTQEPINGLWIYKVKEY
jgi:hypothetical protein